jgi:tetratricopeptide (TPR) repeat protein
MNWQTKEEKNIRRYLLAGALPAEKEQLEERLLGDDDFAERLLLIEDELIDDYARGALPEPEQRLFERNFALTPQRRQKLLIAQELVRYAAENRWEARSETITTPVAETNTAQADDRPARARQVEESRPAWWRPLLRPAWGIPAVATLVLSAGLIAWQPWRQESEVATAMSVLQRAYRDQRPLEARITELDYARFPKLLGAAPDKSDKPDYVTLERAESLLQEELQQRPSVAAQHALGRLYLAQRRFDKAQQLFNDALRADPNNARLHSDLGATLLVKWEQTDSQAAESEELKRQSLAHLSKALELDGSLLEARFNRALLYQSADEQELARKEWEQYLELDRAPNSPWAKEAKTNLTSLSDPQK